MIKKIYTTPKVCKAAKGWYVHFRYQGIQKRYKLGLNYIKNITEREKEANALLTVLHDKLKNGWNPLNEVKATQDFTFIQALEFALEHKKSKISKKSYSGYNGTVTFLKEAVDQLSLQHLKIKETKRVHIKTILLRAKENRSWSNKAYNKHLNHLKAILSELIEWDIIEVNPAHKIKHLIVNQNISNRPPTIDEHTKIKNKLIKDYPFFYNFIVTLFHTGIRPDEILQIQIRMINLKKQEIILPPEITKTLKERVVPINKYLMDCFLCMNLDNYPSNYYLFGSPVFK